MAAVIVEFDLPYALYLDQGRTFRVQLAATLYEVRFTDKRFLGETRRGFGKATNMELKNDRHGTFRYMRISVAFQSQKTKAELAELIEEARAVANRVAEGYRFLTRKTYIEPIKSTDIVSPLVKIQLPDSTWDCAAVVAFPHGLCGLVPNEPAAIQDELQRILADGRQLPLHENLLLNALDYLEKEDLRGALVEGYAAVDVCVDAFLRRTYRSWGWTDLQVERHLRGGRNWQIQTRLKSLVPEATGQGAITSQPLWAGWVRAKRLRDDVTHSGKILLPSATPAAKAALESMQALIVFIQGLKPGEKKPAPVVIQQ